MPTDVYPHLGRRERQIMDALYQLERASVAEVRALLPNPPSYSAVRAMLRILEEKGYVRHVQEGPRYVYWPRQSRTRATKPALSHVVRTFFRGSVPAAVAALVELSEDSLTDADLERLSDILDQARRQRK